MSLTSRLMKEFKNAVNKTLWAKTAPEKCKVISNLSVEIRYGIGISGQKHEYLVLSAQVKAGRMTVTATVPIEIGEIASIEEEVENVA